MDIPAKSQTGKDLRRTRPRSRCPYRSRRGVSQQFPGYGHKKTRGSPARL